MRPQQITWPAVSTGYLVGLLKGEVAATPLAEVVTHKKPLDVHLLELARVLAK